jgi:hypothetical protein
VKFNVGDMVEIVDSVYKMLIGEIAEVVAIHSRGDWSYVRFSNPILNEFHNSMDGVSRLFPNDKLRLYENDLLDVSECDLAKLIGVSL